MACSTGLGGTAGGAWQQLGTGCMLRTIIVSQAMAAGCCALTPVACFFSACTCVHWGPTSVCSTGAVQGACALGIWSRVGACHGIV